MDIEDKLDRPLADLVDERSAAPRGRGTRGRGRGRGARGQKRERDREPDNSSNEPIRVARRIFVSNLTWNTSWQTLKDHFKTVGTVVYADVLRDGSKSKGCGIVEFETAQQAANAINELHLSQLDGREVYVREDREDFELKRNGEYKPPQEKQPRRAPETATGLRVFVGNLSTETSWQTLKDHFNTTGTVAYADVMTDPSGRSKGCGIVEFTDAAAAQEAIESMNNTDLNGREILVREDREAASRGGGHARSGRKAGESRQPHEHVPNSRVYVGNLAYSVTWQALKDHFNAEGAVAYADVLMDPSGRSKGCGIVEFTDAESAQATIDTMQNTTLDGREIFIREDREASRSSRQ